MNELDAHNERQEAQQAPEQAQSSEHPKVNTSRLGRGTRILALLALGAAAAVGCSGEEPTNRPEIEDPNKDPEQNNKGPFEIYYIQSLLTSDGQGYAGVRFNYTLNDDVTGATVKVISFDGDTLYEEGHDLEEGNGNLTFTEPGINGTNTDQFEGAGNAGTVIIEGTDANGNPFSVNATMIE